LLIFILFFLSFFLFLSPLLWRGRERLSSSLSFGEGWGEALKKTAHRDSMSRFLFFWAMAFPLFTVVKSCCATTKNYYSFSFRFKLKNLLFTGAGSF
jgi:preprotein translocase subunit SecG